MANDISSEELELIEAYLLGRLDESAKLSLEGRLRTDETFRQKVDEVRLLMTGIEEQALQKQLPVFHAALSSRNPVPMYRRWWAAAAVILLGGTTWFIWPKESLYQSYFRPDIGLPVTMSSTDSATYLFYDGMVSYKEEKYANAFKKWASLPKTDTVQYYMAMALLNQDQQQEAEKLLLPLADTGQSVFRKEANWYLALIRLKLGDRAGAIERLKLVDREDAKELLKEITD